VALFIQVYTYNLRKPCELSLPLHKVLIIKGVAAHIMCLFAPSDRGLFAVYLVGHCSRHWK
jgi:hypothetical protein